jgi:hypothetical protein
VIIFVAAILAVAAVGVGLYARDQEFRCLAFGPTHFETLPSGSRFRTADCVRWEDGSVGFRDQDAHWWFYGAGALAVLTAIGLVLFRPRRPVSP